MELKMKIYPQLVMAIAFIATGITQAQDTVSWKRCLSQKPQWYSSDEAVRIADNILLYQRNSGGWAKNTEMADVLDDKDKSKLKSQKVEPFAFFQCTSAERQYSRLLGANL